jgi:hypothetical protein
MQGRWTFSLAILAAVTGMLVATGATAAMAFPTVKKIGVLVPAWTSDPQAWMLVAGLPMQKAFAMNDVAAAIGVALAGVLVWPRPQEARSPFRWLTWITLALLALVVACDFFLHSRMNDLLRDIQNANAAGLSAPAAQGHQDFSQLHPIATALMGARLVLLVIGCGAIMRVVSTPPSMVTSRPA